MPAPPERALFARTSTLDAEAVVHGVVDEISDRRSRPVRSIDPGSNANCTHLASYLDLSLVERIVGGGVVARR